VLQNSAPAVPFDRAPPLRIRLTAGLRVRLKVTNAMPDERPWTRAYSVSDYVVERRSIASPPTPASTHSRHVVQRWATV